MSYYGLTAKLNVGGDDMGFISNWSIKETSEIVEITRLGNIHKEKKLTLYSWSGSADGTADFSDESCHMKLLQAVRAGTLITANFYLDANHILSGKAYIERISIDISAEDKANISISMTGVDELVMLPALAS